MSTRIVGFAEQERRRDRRRAIVMCATLDDKDVRILDIGLSGFGAVGGYVRHDHTSWPQLDQKAELKFTDFKGREMQMFVDITYVDAANERFGGSFVELSGHAFDVIQDLMLHRDLRVMQK